MDNSPLRISLLITQIFRILIYIAMAFLLVELGAVIFSRSSPDWTVLNLPGLKFGYSDKYQSTLADTSQSIRIFQLMKEIIKLFLITSVVQLVIKVLQSLKSLETFKNENVKAFRKMGYLFIIIFITSIPSLQMVNGTQQVTISLAPGILLGTLICYLLAEIFREGNRLMEDNKLTI